MPYLLYLQTSIGGLAHLARALRWQRRGDRFESGILHHQPRITRGFFIPHFLFRLFLNRSFPLFLSIQILTMKMRIAHRYLGFFLAGIMAVYAISGIVLIFRDSDTFKRETVETLKIETGLTGDAIGKAADVRKFKIDSTVANITYFKNGSYDSATGEAVITTKELPFVMKKMTGFHKAKSGQPLFFLNIFFGLALLFFVVSAFWMFMPRSPIFRKSLIFTAAGIVVTLVLLFV